MFRLTLLLLTVYHCHGAIIPTEIAPEQFISYLLNEEEIGYKVSNIENAIHEPAVRLITLEESTDSHWPELQLHMDDRSLKMKLKPSFNLATAETKVTVVDEDGEVERSLHPSHVDAFYHGDIEGVAGGSAALGKTDSGWIGMITTDDGRYHLQQVPQSITNQYLLIKQANRDKNLVDLPSIEKAKRADNSARLELEIGAYSDQSFYEFAQKRFATKNPEKKIEELVLVLINDVHHYYMKPELDKKINMVVSSVTILKKQPANLKVDKDMNKYLDNFCSWDAGTKNPHGTLYDMGLLLTGTDLGVTRKNKPFDTGVIGMAQLAGVCLQVSKASCFLGEGMQMDSSLTMAHEIGHNLGMKHDAGENSCPGNTYIMGAQGGPQIQHKFSTCSNKYLNDNIQKLDDFGMNCMRKKQSQKSLAHSVANMLPGERVPYGDQCAIAHGAGYVEGYAEHHFCEAIMCGLKKEVTDGIISEFGDYQSKPYSPLPGTPCGTNKVCWSRKCQDKTVVMKKIKSYTTTAGSAIPKPLGVNALCKKYTNGKLPLAASPENTFEEELAQMCSLGLMCIDSPEGELFGVLNGYLPPNGTPCGTGKTCQNSGCK